MQEQIGWSGDTFNIRDVNGQPTFIMKGKAMSLRQRKSKYTMTSVTSVWEDRNQLNLYAF